MSATCCRCREPVEGDVGDPMVITQNPPAVWCAGCARYVPDDVAGEQTMLARDMLSLAAVGWKPARKTLREVRA